MRALTPRGDLRFVRSALFASLLLGAFGCGGGGGTADGGDASNDAIARNDRLNLYCSSPAGDIDPVACNTQLGMRAMGATFFIGGRADCGDNPSSPACVPLCMLSDMSSDQCNFTATPGCRINRTEGYVVVVQSGASRWTSAVGDGESCGSVGTQGRQWARVGIDDLVGAANCARTIPAGGFGPVRFGPCTTPMATCGPAGTTDTCQTLNFMAGMQMYMSNVCTRTCNGDSDCGGRGSCQNGVCWNRCGGPCALDCQAGFTCNVPMGATEGFCLPNPPQ